jgi:hypothetical protein
MRINDTFFVSLLNSLLLSDLPVLYISEQTTAAGKEIPFTILSDGQI